MSAQVSFLPAPTPSELTSLSTTAAAAAPTNSLSSLPYLTDESWLKLNNLLSSQPTGNWGVHNNNNNPASSPQPSQSQIRKRRNHNPIRHSDPLSPDREEADRRKRENFLARNRRAATKCRQRKRQFTKQLESQYEQVSARKQSLETEFAQLQKEVLELKDELLRHSQCADPAIQSHLAGMVKNVTVASSNKSPGLAPSCPLPPAVPGFEGIVPASSSVSFSSESGGRTACEGQTERPRRDSAFSVSTDASLDSFIDEGLFEEMLNFA